MNIEQVRALPDRELQIRVAEYLGYRVEERPRAHLADRACRFMLCDPNGFAIGNYADDPAKCWNYGRLDGILPTFHSSLDAFIPALRRLVREFQAGAFGDWLRRLTGEGSEAYAFAAATPRQYAEAFVLTRSNL